MWLTPAVSEGGGAAAQRRARVDGSRNPAGTGEVVSIRAHAGYRPDFRALASGQVSAARAKLGLTHAEFAEYLSEQLGWVPSAAVVKRWEQGSIPPGDAVLAAAVISQDVP